MKGNCPRILLGMIFKLALCVLLAMTQQRIPTRPTENTPGPATSSDNNLAASIRGGREVWIEDPMKPESRRLFECPGQCRNPQFSPDARSVFVVVDLSPTAGALWKIEIATGKAAEFIPGAARFRVIQIGPYTGFVIADQPTLTEADGTPYEYPYYVFFIFRPTGTRIGRISRGVADDVDALLMEYSQ
jgi:hypothetical protein